MTDTPDIRHLIRRIEDGGAPAPALDAVLRPLLKDDPRLAGCLHFDFDTARESAAVLAPGWIVDHIGEDAVGHVGALRPVGFSCTLSNGEHEASGSGDNHAQALIAATLRAHVGDVHDPKPGIDAAEMLNQAVDALVEARLQIEYLQGKFGDDPSKFRPTGSGNAVLDRIADTVARIRRATDDNDAADAPTAAR